MAYLALYRRFRPDRFENLIGQEHIVRTLTNQIELGRVGHAYLFCGARGTGKTSAAKIFARAVNCEHPVGGSPCNECATCRALSDPSNIDILEIDAASNNGVDEIREIREKVQFLPVHGKYKVYIIDEVHMLSTGAFNALLKTLEEPPAHVIFILATTEIHKLPATILSRCMRFDFHLVSEDKLAALISKIYDEVGKKYTKEAVYQIARAGEGSCRDALSLADMCMSVSEELTYDDVLTVMGAADISKIYALAADIVGEDSYACVCKLQELLALGKGAGVLSGDLVRHFRDLCVVKLTDRANDLLKLPQNVYEQFRATVARCSYEKLLYCTNLLTSIEGDLKFTLHPEVLLETAVLRCCRPQEQDRPENLQVRIAELEHKIEQGVRVGPSVPAENVQPVRSGASGAGADAANRTSAHRMSAESQTEASQAWPIRPTPAAAKRTEFTPQESRPASVAEPQTSAPEYGLLAEEIPFPMDMAPPPEEELSPAPVSAGRPAARQQAAHREPPKAVPVQDSAEAVFPAGRSDQAAARKVWGSVIKALRTTKPSLFAICMDLEPFLEGNALVVQTASQSAQTILSQERNQTVLNDIVRQNGLEKVIVRGKEQRGTASENQRDYQPVRDLIGSKLTEK